VRLVAGWQRLCPSGGDGVTWPSGRRVASGESSPRNDQGQIYTLKFWATNGNI
jgi:hypothetical protein